MTNREMVNVFFERHGYKLVKEGDNFAPILPYIIMDECYSLYRRVILPIECGFEMKRARKIWSESYNAFNKDFFNCYGEEQRAELIEKMDNFEEYIAKDEMIAKVQIMNQFPDEPLDRQNVIATCILCSILVQSAQIVWARIYKNSQRRGMENMDLKNIRKGINGFANLYYGKEKLNIKVDDNPEVCKAVNVLCRKMIKWLKQ